MANEEHLAKLKEGVEVWDQWRREHGGIQADLQEALLMEAHLEGANLYGAHLERANLYGAHLEGANLREAFFDPGTRLKDTVLAEGKSRCAVVADLSWG